MIFFFACYGVPDVAEHFIVHQAEEVVASAEARDASFTVFDHAALQAVGYTDVEVS